MSFKKIDSVSNDTILSSLNLWKIPDTVISTSKSQYKEYLTLNPVTEFPLHFKIFGGSSFLDLSKSYLFTEFSIEKSTKDGWVALPKNEEVAPIQGIGATFIQNLVVSLNGREVYNSNGLQAYKAYLDYTLSYGKEAHESHLQCAGFYPQSTIADTKDSGFQSRKNLFANGQKVQFISRIGCPLFTQPILLLNNMEMDIEIIPHMKEKFPIIASNNESYRLVLHTCKLFVKNVDLVDNLSLTMSKMLEQKPAKYSTKRCELKHFYISADRTDFVSNIFTDQIPRRLVLGLLNNQDFSGFSNNNPFNFVHGNVRSISVSANGTEYPHTPYVLNYKDNDYVRAYYDTMENVGLAYTQQGNGINYEMFKNGACVYVFNLTTTLEDVHCFDLIKNGSTSVSINFGESVPKTGFVLLVYAEFDSLTVIDKNRNISTDLTA